MSPWLVRTHVLSLVTDKELEDVQMDVKEIKKDSENREIVYKEKIKRLLEKIDDEELFKRIYVFIHKLLNKK